MNENPANLLGLHGRRALITGAAGHLGLAFAETLNALGADLILVDKRIDRLQDMQKSLNSKNKGLSTWLYCDLENEQSRTEAISEIKNNIPHLNILINNAAFLGSSELKGWTVPLEQQSLETWRSAIEVNLTTAFHLAQGLAPMLQRVKGANIVNISSIYGALAPDWRIYAGTTMGNPAAYGASKAGLESLTRYLATTLSPQIRVNAIAPGGVERNQNPAFVKAYTERTPLRRLATESDISNVLAFLVSDLASYLTGQIITVDGGYSSC